MGTTIPYTVFDAPVAREGKSFHITVTRAVRLMGIKPGDIVRVTIEKLDYDRKEEDEEEERWGWNR